MDGAVTHAASGGLRGSLMHIGRAGRVGVIALFVVGALASPAVAAQGGPDPNFGSHGSVLSGWPASTAAVLDALQLPGGKIVTFGATGDTGEQIDLNALQRATARSTRRSVSSGTRSTPSPVPGSPSTRRSCCASRTASTWASPR